MVGAAFGCGAGVFGCGVVGAAFGCGAGVLGWAGGFVLQAVLRWLLLDHALIGALLPMTGLAFVIYTNYMITDPATNLRSNQVVLGPRVPNQ